MAYSECLPTRLNPLAERTCFSQVGEARRAEAEGFARGEQHAGADIGRGLGLVCIARLSRHFRAAGAAALRVKKSQAKAGN